MYLAIAIINWNEVKKRKTMYLAIAIINWNEVK